VNKNAPSGPAWPVKQHRRASILTALDDGGIMTLQEIADELGTKASSISPSLTSLKQAGMIEQAGAGKWGLTAVQQKLMRESHAA
jgi:DNA-binding IclR family transcriptional regulator